MTTFGRLFRDPTPPNLEFRPKKKTPPRQYGELSNATAFVGRGPFLSRKVAAIFDEMCDLPRQAERKQASNNNNKQASISGSASESLSESLIPTPFEPADGDFAEGGHRKRALIRHALYCILCEA